MPDRCSKFEESKHLALIFRRISSAQRSGGVFFPSLEASLLRISEFLFAKVCQILFGKTFACSLDTFWCYMPSTSDLESRTHARSVS